MVYFLINKEMTSLFALLFFLKLINMKMGLIMPNKFKII